MNVMDKKGPYSLQALDGPFFNGVSDYLNQWADFPKMKDKIYDF